MKKSERFSCTFLDPTILCYFFSMFAALLITVSLSINLEKKSLITSFDGNSIVYVILWAIFTLLTNRAFHVTDKRLVKFSIVASALLSFSFIVGFTLNTYLDLSGLYSSKGQAFKNILVFFGYFFLFYSVLILIYEYLINKTSHNGLGTGFILPVKKKSFLFVWLIIFLSWIPYFLMYFPGILTSDSTNQIEQALGDVPFTNHHPAAHTMAIGIFIHIGKALGDIKIGVFLFSLFQMLFMSAVFSFSIYYMSRKGIQRYFRIGALLYYAIFPIHGYYSITMWKDQPFACFFLLFVICCIELVTKQESFFIKKSHWTLFFFVSLGVVLFRNNGIYIYILSIPLLMLFLKMCRKQIAVISFGCLLVFSLYKGPVFSALNIQQGSKREALSIPLQQIARVVKYHGAELSDQHQEVIHSILPAEDIGKLYNPRLSDPVKNKFNDDYYEKHKKAFYKTWAELLIRYPKVYVESFLCNNYGYWYPQVQYGTVSLKIYPNKYGIVQQSFLPGLRQNVEKYTISNLRYFPVVSMFYSIGFNFILLCVLFLLSILKRRYTFLLVFVPVFSLWLTVIASPGYVEFRYIYGLFTCLPVILSFALHLKNSRYEDIASGKPDGHTVISVHVMNTKA